ncbi:MAG: hypothetical protein M1821_003809 [Bathelium mastoideum]|nr:MAG: hypothetical protein M1821_003809 [Bathelium mastoideum]
MIWIDQECIQQDDEIEKETGIQAMDNVYSRAYMSIGLFQTGFREQKHLDAFCMLAQEQTSGAGFVLRPGCCIPPMPSTTDEETFVEMLTTLAKEKWLTRAWILQEAFASGGTMCILMPRNERLSAHGRKIICNDLSTTEIAIEFGLLDQVLKSAVCFYDEDLGKQLRSRSSKRRMRRPGVDDLQTLRLRRYQAVTQCVRRQDEVQHPKDWSQKLAQLARLYPEVRSSQVQQLSVSGVKPRRPCNAALALSYLNDRKSSIPADRLAIIANLCDYHLRLNVAEMQKLDVSPSVCVLALALMNGDLSLLWPESYDPFIDSKVTNNNNDDYSWLPYRGPFQKFCLARRISG